MPLMMGNLDSGASGDSRKHPSAGGDTRATVNRWCMIPVRGLIGQAGGTSTGAASAAAGACTLPRNHLDGPHSFDHTILSEEFMRIALKRSLPILLFLALLQSPL